MEKPRKDRLSSADWIDGALELMTYVGIDGVKIVPLAATLGVTSGSFYWHFKNRRELLDAVLAYWEKHMTDEAIEVARNVPLDPKARIHGLMQQVMNEGLARYDLAIWHWAECDETAQTVFKRVLDKRFAFAAWMFGQIGFDDEQAKVRGRMMVVYMMSESTLVPGTPESRKKQVDLQFEILTSSCA
jgi:AcrR family transcriptional regulator